MHVFRLNLAVTKILLNGFRFLFILHRKTCTKEGQSKNVNS